MLCLRTVLEPEHRAELLKALRMVTDWDDIARRTIPHRIPMLVHHHLVSNFRDDLPGSFIEKLHEQAMWQAQSCLKIIAAQKRLIQDVLDKCDAPRVFFKGFSIGDQLYPDPCLRFCRDIDIWVNPDHLESFWRAAKAAGYVRLKKPDKTHLVPIKHIARFVPTMELLSPTRDLIEVHFRYDHSGLTVDPRRVFERSILLDTSIGQMRIPSFEDHFAYICQHHTRHLWARLRWLVDLDAFRRSPQFDRAKILQAVEGTDLVPTVKACLELADHLFPASGEISKEQELSAEANDLYQWILRALKEGPEANHEAQVGHKSPDFPLPWQYGWRHLLQVKAERFKPTFADYLFMPLNRNFWWLYYFLRPIRIAASLFKRRFLRTVASK